MTKITAKTVLALLVVVALASLGGCSDDSKKKNNADAGMDGGGDVDGGVSTTGLAVGNAAVRSCDLLFQAAAGTVVTGVDFGDGVVGKSKHRAPKVSLSFFARADEAISGTVAEVSVGPADGQNPASLDAPALTKATCYDRDGNKVENPEISF